MSLCETDQSLRERDAHRWPWISLPCSSCWTRARAITIRNSGGRTIRKTAVGHDAIGYPRSPRRRRTAQPGAANDVTAARRPAKVTICDPSSSTESASSGRVEPTTLSTEGAEGVAAEGESVIAIEMKLTEHSDRFEPKLG